MRELIVIYLRLIGFSVAAVGLAACTRLAPQNGFFQHPEPRFGEAPSSAEMTAPLPPMTDDERLAQLERQIGALEGEITHLRKVLDVLGPLPEHASLFIPVALTEVDTKAEELSKLYAVAPALDRANSLFYQAELGSFASQAAAEARWSKLLATRRLDGLRPGYADANAEIRLTAGPFSSEDDVHALCVELSALAGPCRVAAPIRMY